MQDTKIEWADATFNPVRGCSHVSRACDHCYAERMATRMAGTTYAGLVDRGRWNGRVQLVEGSLDDPARRRKPSRIFLCSMGDLFHEDVPFDYITRVVFAIHRADWHTFMLLTKRPERMAEYFRACVSPPPRNLWVGATVEEQSVVDSRVRALLEIDASIRFVSCEPLLGPVDISRYLWIAWRCSYCGGHFGGEHKRTCPDCGMAHGWCGSHKFNPPSAGEMFPRQAGRGIHWVIAGGETGPSARPMHPDWIHGLEEQCQKARTPFFFKGWGAWRPDPNLVYGRRPSNNQIAVRNDGKTSRELTPDKRLGGEWSFMVKGQRLTTLNGVEHKAFPEGAPRGGDL